MLQRAKGKKGFTLAELLIVVAIIAVLTAIAVPLFVGALSNAKESVGAANIRAVRAEATEKILFDQQKPEANQQYKSTNSTWYVRAQITSSGDLKVLEISGTAPVAADTNKDKYTTSGTSEEDKDTGNKGGYLVYLQLKDITPATSLTQGSAS